MVLTMKTLNLQQKKGMLLTVNQKVMKSNEIKFVSNSLESNLCDYSDAHILVTGNITVTRSIAAAATAAAGGNIKKKNLMQIHTLYLKIVHYLKIVEQKLMTLLLIIQILLILQCLCTI